MIYEREIEHEASDIVKGIITLILYSKVGRGYVGTQGIFGLRLSFGQ